MPDKKARPLCLERLLEDLVAGGASKLVLESDESLQQSDRRLIAQHLKALGGADGFQYMHCKAHEEPLLWVSDAVAWCHQKGGDWIRKASPLVQKIVFCER
ncbi:hypothetical protein ARTHRO9V_280375 [Arthrobacter sp. 9V]|uniref:hypothetical protein n=1 Tax=Arthrobacter sp. 9V TaxID=2653132 RepID=UPI0012F2E82E|nr:hypothetical protein [Arthrobacter sp. 9V]VXC53471.1 hypothetical protein ARTHRO9V_280375 [Arthrobacter sp. 9V]